MNFSIGAAHQVLEIPPRLGLCGKSRDFCQVRRRAFIQEMKMPELLEAHPLVGVGFELVQRSLQFGPAGPLGGHKAFQIDDHSACLRLTFRYWLTSSTLSRSS